jgi:hypothetical protein
MKYRVDRALLEVQAKNQAVRAPAAIHAEAIESENSIADDIGLLPGTCKCRSWATGGGDAMSSRALDITYRDRAEQS